MVVVLVLLIIQDQMVVFILIMVILMDMVAYDVDHQIHDDHDEDAPH